MALGNEHGVACNRRVHAEIRVVDAVHDDEYVEAEFRNERWSFEAIAPRRYLVSIPVYSAEFAAMDVARAKILDFGEQRATLELDYMRVQRQRPRMGFLYRARSASPEAPRASGALTGSASRRFGAAVGQEPRPSWEIYSDVALGDHYLDHLEERFTPNYPGGEIELRKISSPPDRPRREVPERRWRRALRPGVVFAGAFALALVLLAYVASLSEWTLGGSAALLGVITFGVMAAVKASVNVSGWWAKAGSFLLPFVLLGMIGVLFEVLYRTSDGYPWGRIVLVVAVVGVARGLLHLLRLRPRVRVVASLSVVTALAAGSFGGMRLFLSALASEFGVPYAQVLVPAWIAPVVGAALLAYLLIGVVIAASIWGWFEYVGASTAFRKWPDVFTLFVSLLFLMITMSTLVAALAAGQERYGQWLEQYAHSKTPGITSDFMYRACVSERPGSDTPASGPVSASSPVVVIEGQEGPGWAWDAQEWGEEMEKRVAEAEQRSAATGEPYAEPDVPDITTVPLDPQVHLVRSVDDDVRSCG